LNSIHDALPSREYPAGYVLFKRGDPAEKAYLLLSGEVDIFLPPNQEPMARLGPGDLLGEQAILSGGLRSATAVAAKAISCTEITTDSLRSLLGQQTTLIRPVIESLMLQLALENTLRSQRPSIS
jgi:CRP-like cAMP-binding protein